MASSGADSVRLKLSMRGTGLTRDSSRVSRMGRIKAKSWATAEEQSRVAFDRHRTSPCASSFTLSSSHVTLQGDESISAPRPGPDHDRPKLCALSCPCMTSDRLIPAQLLRWACPCSSMSARMSGICQSRAGMRAAADFYACLHSSAPVCSPAAPSRGRIRTPLAAGTLGFGCSHVQRVCKNHGQTDHPSLALLRQQSIS